MNKELIWGRDEPLRRAMWALDHRRNVLITGGRGAGRTRILSALTTTMSTPSVRVRQRPGGMISVFDSAGAAAVVEEARVPAMVADLVADETTILVDDLDRFPAGLIETLIGAVLHHGATFVAITCPAVVASAVDRRLAAALKTLCEHPRTVSVMIEPLSLADSTRLSDSLRTRHFGSEPGDDVWNSALHRLTGGNPALIEKTVEFAAAAHRLDALMPLDPACDPLTGRIVDIAQDMIASLTSDELCVLSVIRELGPTPLRYLRVAVTAGALATLRDCGLLSASTDTFNIAACEIAARVAADRLGRAEIEGCRGRVAAGLLGLATSGTRLGIRAVTFCARYAPEPGDECGIATLQQLRDSAALAVARSSRPADAIRMAGLVLDRPGPVPVRSRVALALAYDAVGRGADADVLLADVSPPADPEEATLLVRVLVNRLVAIEDGGAQARERLSVISEWLGDDPSWGTIAESAMTMFRILSDPTVEPLEMQIPAARPGADADAVAYRDANVAVLSALRGNGGAAIALMEPRRQRHGLDAEPRLDIYQRHVLTSIMLQHDLPAVRASLRRRMLTARCVDRQDDLTVLAILDAALHARLGDADGIFGSLSCLRLAPSANTRVWTDLLLAVGYAMVGDVINASAALARAEAVPSTWAGRAYGLARTVTHVLIDVIAGRSHLALHRIGLELPLAERHAPVFLPTMLELALRAGMRPSDLLSRATGYARRFDLPALTALIEQVRETLGEPSVRSLDRLTAREREVVLLAASGHTNAVIAERLHLSIRTVESHLHHARTRLGMSRSERFEVVTRAAPRRVFAV